MDRNTALTVALAVLAVLALAVAAATLDTARETGGQAGQVGGGANPEQSGVGEESGGIDLGSEVESTQGSPIVFCVEFLKSPEGLLLGALGLLVLFFLVARSANSYGIAAVFVLALLVPITVVWLVLTSCGPVGSPFSQLSQAANASSLPVGGGSAGAQGDASRSITSPSSLLAIVLLVALAGSVVLLLSSTGDADETPADTDEPEPESVDVAALGRAAGEAADRIADEGDVDNEVYRAWVEMTEHLAVDNPASSTPAEFARAAVDAGMDEADVRELTDIFEEVRYGGEAPTPERERRAIDALRRIESSYAESDVDADADTQTGTRTGTGTDPGDDS